MKKYILAGAVILILDQATKLLAAGYLESIAIINGFLSLTLRKNTGAGFSILAGNNLLLAGISALIIVGLLYYFTRFKKRERIFAAVIIGGAVGNLIDRIAHGYVIDFIDFSFWPTFNIADSAITVGIIGLLYLSFKN